MAVTKGQAVRVFDSAGRPTSTYGVVVSHWPCPVTRETMVALAGFQRRIEIRWSLCRPVDASEYEQQQLLLGVVP